MAERILATQAALEARGAAAGKRKTITALFADIKDSTALIEDLDPEDARRLIDPALQLMTDAVAGGSAARTVSVCGAATSLTRLWQQQGKKKDAHQMLTEIYGWFTEGFDTAELQEAKALLDELA